MKTANNSPKILSLRRVLPVVAIALALAGVPRAWGQCTQGIASFSLSAGSVIALGPGAPGQVTLNCPATFNYYILYVEVFEQGTFVGSQELGGLGNTNFPFAVGWGTNVTSDLPLTVIATLFPLGITAGPASLLVLPNGSAETGANMGVCPSNSCNAGAPINITDGNTWINESDYSVPGLGGGLELTRVWNSRWPYASPPALAGAFGYGWRSTYEEMLAGPDSNNNMTYWRGDGSAWTFAYNNTLNTFSLTSPPNVRAQLVQNPATGLFTITFADGTQRVFNTQNLLSTIIDRNGNQTTIAYDTSNRITTITSPGGSTLTFTYGDPNNTTQATTVQDTVGTVATYTYDNMSRLTQVVYSDSSQYNYAYDANSNILSVTDSQGKLIEGHTYDSQNRGLTSTQAYGVNSVSLSY
jgi:YD repeat-containing protein